MIVKCTKLDCGKPFDRGVNSICPHCGTAAFSFREKATAPIAPLTEHCRHPTWNDLLNHIQEMSAEDRDQNATIQLSFDEFIMVQGWGISKDGDGADGILDHGHHYLVVMSPGKEL